jgi:hypothetical protein
MLKMNINFLLPDLIGLSGVTCIVTAFALLQVGKLKLDELPYSLINLIGAVLIFISLMFNWNLASVVMECIWMSFSAYGVAKNLWKRAK